MAKKKRRKRQRAYSKKMPFRKRKWIAQHYRCPLCGIQIRQRKLWSDDINIDHIRPRSHGGSSDPDNLQVVHKECNQAKGANCAGCEFCAPEEVL